MKVVITGGGGFLGCRLARPLLAGGHLTAPDGRAGEISKLVLLDAAFPPQLPADPRLEAIVGDVSDAATVARVVTADTGSLFHLPAVVTGPAQAPFYLRIPV